MGAHLIFFIIFTLFSCIILTNQSLPWYSLRSGFQCDTNMAAVFSCMRPVSPVGLRTGDPLPESFILYSGRQITAKQIRLTQKLHILDITFQRGQKNRIRPITYKIGVKYCIHISNFHVRIINWKWRS